MGSPELAGEFVQDGGRSGAVGGFNKVIGEHSFSVRDQSPAEGRARFQAKLRRRQKWHLQQFSFSGSIWIAETLIFPGFAGTPARLSRRVSCFWGFVLRVGAIRPT